jgi:hypothetical protein
MKKETREDAIMNEIQDIILRWEFAGSSKWALKRIKNCLETGNNAQVKK